MDFLRIPIDFLMVSQGFPKNSCEFPKDSYGFPKGPLRIPNDSPKDSCGLQNGLSNDSYGFPKGNEILEPKRQTDLKPKPQTQNPNHKRNFLILGLY